VHFQRCAARTARAGGAVLALRRPARGAAFFLGRLSAAEAGFGAFAPGSERRAPRPRF